MEAKSAENCENIENMGSSGKKKKTFFTPLKSTQSKESENEVAKKDDIPNKTRKSKNSKKLKKTIDKGKEVSLTNSQYDDIFKSVLKAREPDQKKDNSSLVNAELDDIFQSGINVKSGKNSQDLSSQSASYSNSEDVKKSIESKKKLSKDDRIILSGSQTRVNSQQKIDSQITKKSSQKLDSQPMQYRSKESSQKDEHIIILGSSQQKYGSQVQKNQSQVNLSQKGDDNLQRSQTRQAGIVSGFGSQKSIPETTYCLSQPSKDLNPRQRLEWLQERRNVGLWVMCSYKNCSKWRYLKDVVDPLDLPEDWFCTMNPDPEHNSCSAPEHGPSPLEDDDLIYNQYNCGSIVWGKVAGYPWWPAMVDDEPDTEQYYWLDQLTDVPTYYHVVFFDDKAVSRSWLTPDMIQSFTGYETSREFKQVTFRGINYSYRVSVAKQQAKEARKLDLKDRLKKYSFLARYKGRIGYHEKIDHPDEDAHRRSRKISSKLDKLIQLSNKETDEKSNLKKRKKTSTSAIHLNGKIRKTQKNHSKKETLKTQAERFGKVAKREDKIDKEKIASGQDTNKSETTSNVEMTPKKNSDENKIERTKEEGKNDRERNEQTGEIVDTLVTQITSQSSEDLFLTQNAPIPEDTVNVGVNLDSVRAVVNGEVDTEDDQHTKSNVVVTMVDLDKNEAEKIRLSEEKKKCQIEKVIWARNEKESDIEDEEEGMKEKESEKMDVDTQQEKGNVWEKERDIDDVVAEDSQNILEGTQASDDIEM